MTGRSVLGEEGERAAARFLEARGYEVLTPGRGPMRQLLCRHEPVVVRKPA